LILVIGATGKTGGEVARQLAATKTPTRAFVRNPARAAALKEAGVELVEGDLDNKRALDQAMRGVESVFIATSPDRRMADIQITAMDAAKRAGAKRIVKISSLGAAVDSPSLLGRLNLKAEEALKRSGLDWTILRPNFFMQNLLRFAPAIATEGTIYAPAGTGKGSQVDARDIASVAVTALTNPAHAGKTHVLTGPEAVSYQDCAERIGLAIGRPVRHMDVSPETARDGMLASGLPAWYVDDLVTLMRDVYAKGYASEVTDVVKEVTGRAPRTFYQFAEDHAELFRGGM
jgi:uncharacterized protein YbjT (DUF2867 family)